MKKSSRPGSGGAERIQKVLARAGLGSRRSVEELVRDGRVTVNGRLAELGEKVDVLKDALKVNGKRVKLPTTHRYLLLNKPDSVMTTRDDPEDRRTVYDLLPKSLHPGLFPVGRLDYHTEGLLLLTTDGRFGDRLTHPRYRTPKVYLVKVRGEPSESALGRLRRGVVLDGRRTAPCEIESRRVSGVRLAKKNTWWQVTLSEGRTRQIRRMFERIGHPVQRLRRVAIGGLRDGRLATGDFRELTELEVERLLAGDYPPPKAARKKAATAGKPRSASGRAGTKDGRGKRTTKKGPARKGGAGGAKASSKSAGGAKGRPTKKKTPSRGGRKTTTGRKGAGRTTGGRGGATRSKRGGRGPSPSRRSRR